MSNAVTGAELTAALDGIEKEGAKIDKGRLVMEGMSFKRKKNPIWTTAVNDRYVGLVKAL